MSECSWCSNPEGGFVKKGGIIICRKCWDNYSKAEMDSLESSGPADIDELNAAVARGEE